MSLEDPLEGAYVSRCRWCLARTEIVWAKTVASNLEKQIPIERLPNPKGNVEIKRLIGPVWAATVYSGPPGMVDDWVAFMPHHATCKRDLQQA